jgi:hypothetical protein
LSYSQRVLVHVVCYGLQPSFSLMPHMSVRVFLSTWKYKKGILPGGRWPNIRSKSSDRTATYRASRQA